MKLGITNDYTRRILRIGQQESEELMITVGSKVKIIKEQVYAKFPAGYIGIVTDVCEDGYLEGYGSCTTYIIDDEWYYPLDKLELVEENLQINIKYFTSECHITKLKLGDWIDLRSAIDIQYKAGDFNLIPLGVAMELPKGHEAHVVPRSSTFKNFGIIQTNSLGIIDESFAGNNDQWFMPAYSLRDGSISKGDRICQFRIVKKMPKVEFIEVKTLGNPDRGGHGSTGVR